MILDRKLYFSTTKSDETVDDFFDTERIAKKITLIKILL